MRARSRYHRRVLTPMVRWALAASCLGFGLREVLNDRWQGLGFALVGLALMAGHFLFGSVRLAFFSLRRGDLARAQRLLERSPTRFHTRETRGYYHWVRAALAEARGTLPEARDELQTALGHRLRGDTDRVLALGTLAAIHAKLGERKEARQRLEEADALGPDVRVRALLAKVRAQI